MNNSKTANITILLKNFNRASGSINVLKNSKDEKLLKKARNNLIGKIILYVVLTAYCGLTAFGYCRYGLTDHLPVLTAIVSAAIGFIFTLLKTNGYLFAFREYDMIMSMPLSEKEIIASKFLYMYLSCLPVYLCISFPILVMYVIFAGAGILSIPLWLLFSLLLPLIPMTLASLIGAIITWISSGFKHKNIIASVLLILFTLLILAADFFIDRDSGDDIGVLVNGIDGVIASISGLYPPAQWFSGAIKDLSLIDILLFPCSSIVIFGIFVTVTGIFYKKINSRLMTSQIKRNYKMKAQKTKKPEWSIAFKEFKRMISSTIYLTNIGLGVILTFALGIAAIFADVETLISTTFKDAPITTEMITPIIPLIVYFFIGMVPSTVCSSSLEGKNAWILKSMPISSKNINRGKMLFNLCLSIPCALFTTLMLCLSFRCSFIVIILCCICTITLCLFSTVYGMRCGLKHLRLDWENEIEIIKQGKATVTYLLPNMFCTMLLCVGIVSLNGKLDARILIAGLTVVAGLLTILINSGLKKYKIA